MFEMRRPRASHQCFPHRAIIALEVLEIPSCDPVTNYWSKEKESRTERNREKVQDVQSVLFLLTPCVSQCLLQTCMRKQMLYTLSCHIDTILRKDDSLGHSRQSFFCCYCESCTLWKLGFFTLKRMYFTKMLLTGEVNIWYCKLIRLCYLVTLFSNRILILTVGTD